MIGMTRLVRTRRIVQPLFFSVLGLAILALSSCTPSIDRNRKASPGTTTPKKSTALTPPVIDIPEVEVPAEKPATEKPAAEKPAEEKPAAEKPATEKPAEEKPAAEKPATEKPAEEKPATEKPAEEKPAAEKTSEVKPVVEEKVASNLPAKGKPVTEPVAKEEGAPGPTELPVPAWLPKPVVEVPEAEAKDDAAMKPYTEPIPDTDAKFDMVPIKGGKFKMGSPEGEENRNADEGPQHEVGIEPFWMGKYEVTWAEFELWGMKLDAQRRDLKRKQNNAQPTDREKLVDSIALPTNPYSDMTFGMGKEGYPAICMTQLAAKMYCKWLSAKTGHYYRLPTEAEWEYAARAGTDAPYSFGKDADKLGDYAWHFDNADDKYHKVGQKKPNPWGLYDMHGNVAEWVLDQYKVDAYKDRAGKPAANPLLPGTTEYGRIVRGGAWTDDAPLLRSAARRSSHKDWKKQDPQIPQSIWYLTDAQFAGFRVVRPLRTPTVEEAKKYEIDEEQFTEFKDYLKSQHGKM